MRSARTLRLLRTLIRPRPTSIRSCRPPILVQSNRYFQTFAALQKIQTHKLSDIGEGVKEVQIIQWFVEEGAAVEEWAPLCEVQSDKASVEITSKYTGVVKKLHFDRDAIVQVGDAMLDIEVEGGEEEPAESDESEQKIEQEEPQNDVKAEDDAVVKEPEPSASQGSKQPEQKVEKEDISKTEKKEPTSDQGGGLATPAVRGLLKEHDIEITDVQGTGRDGRVLKEDVLKYVENGKQTSQPNQATSTGTPTPTPKPGLDAKQVETTQSLTAIQSAMFKTMTKSLSIPHFLFSDRLNVTGLAAMRSRLNATRNPETTPKYTYLPFIIKAVSLALNQYPILNSRIDTSDANKPKIILRSNHNIGIAVDTPSGLLVPVIKNVNARSITSIAQEIKRLSQLGQAGKLTNNDFSGGTITVSNIGNIGGETVAPVIVDSQVAILGIGKIRPTPVFAADGETIERADLMNTSWSADHRVVDGATMARMAKLVQTYIEEPETMLVDMS